MQQIFFLRLRSIAITISSASDKYQNRLAIVACQKKKKMISFPVGDTRTINRTSMIASFNSSWDATNVTHSSFTFALFKRLAHSRVQSSSLFSPRIDSPRLNHHAWTYRPNVRHVCLLSGLYSNSGTTPARRINSRSISRRIRGNETAFSYPPLWKFSSLIIFLPNFRCDASPSGKIN